MKVKQTRRYDLGFAEILQRNVEHEAVTSHGSVAKNDKCAYMSNLSTVTTRACKISNITMTLIIM
jgi:hypothetical protein